MAETPRRVPRHLRPSLWWCLLTVLLCAAVWGSPASAVEQPDGYRLPPYRAVTPLALDGATTVRADQVQKLQLSGVPLIDVRGATLSTVPPLGWIVSDPKQVIAGALWLPNVGQGDASAALVGWFADELEHLTHGDLGAGLVFYCQSDCWMSWNAAKRALSLGYRQVYWFRDGIEAWQDAGFPTEKGHPQPYTGATP